MRSYFKFLSRNLFYTLVEATGLTVGLAFVIIIGCCAWQRFAISLEHPDCKQIYYVRASPYETNLTYGFKDVVEERVPEVERTVRIAEVYGCTYECEDRAVPVKLFATEKSFFDMFPRYRILEGSADALLSKDAVLVSRTFANTYDLRPGATLMIHDFSTDPVTVGGIVEDFRNTTFCYVDIIASVEHSRFDNLRKGMGNCISIVKLRKDSDVEAVWQKMDNICKEIYPTVNGQSNFQTLVVTRLDHVPFKIEGHQVFESTNKWVMLIMTSIALLLLFSSVFNYINLNTALVGRRAKEMAVRRLVGAQRAAIIGRYIGESIGFTALCFGMALLLAMAFAPVLQQRLYVPDITIAVVFTPATITGYLLLILLVGTLSGLIPALLAARFQPVDIVKGRFRMHNKMTFSKVFIVFQNVLTVFFLAMALVMEAQYYKVLHRPVNANIEDKYIFLPSIQDDKNSLRDVFVSLPCVKRIGRACAVPTFPMGGSMSVTRSGERIFLYEFLMDTTAFSMLGIEKKLDFNAPLYNSVWFSESAFTTAGLNEEDYDVSDMFSAERGFSQLAAGTFTDFAVNSLTRGGEQAVIVLYKDEEIPHRLFYVLETVGDHKEVERQIEEAHAKWTKENFGMFFEPTLSCYLTDHLFYSLHPFRYWIFILELFMLATILISMLGLLAMSTYYVGEQAKSIAIRKAFGGTVVSETIKNVRSYMIMVGVACMIALPPAVWVADKYVERFVYRIENYWWIFFVAVVLAMAIAFAAVFWQVWSAARTNPVVELKKE